MKHALIIGHMTNCCNRLIQNDLSNDVQSYFSSEILKVFHNLIVGSSGVIKGIGSKSVS